MRPYYLVCIALLVCSALVSATEAEKTFHLTGTISENTYLANDEVDVNAEVDGDLLIAAGDIDVSGLVRGDLMLAGGRINIAAELRDDLRAAGGEVSLCSQVSGDVAIAGGDIDICADTVIGNKAWLAGGDIKADGRFEKKLVIKAGDAVLAGVFADGVRIEAQHIEVVAGARILGDLEYTSPEPAGIDQGAMITGEVTHTKSSTWWGSSDGKLGTRELVFSVFVSFFLLVFSVVITSLVLVKVLPNTFAETPKIIRTQSLKCLAIGLLFVLVTPLLLAVLAISVVGLPLAIIFFFAYVLLLFIGFFAGVMLLADSFDKNFGKSRSRGTLAHIFAILVAALFITLLSQLPIVGNLFVCLLTIGGIGAVILFAQRSRELLTSAKIIIEE